MDGTRSVVGNDVVRRLAIVRIDAASGAGWVGSHRSGGWGLMNETCMAGAGDLVPHFFVLVPTDGDFLVKLHVVFRVSSGA